MAPMHNSQVADVCVVVRNSFCTLANSKDCPELASGDMHPLLRARLRSWSDSVLCSHADLASAETEASSAEASSDGSSQAPTLDFADTPKELALERPPGVWSASRRQRRRPRGARGGRRRHRTGMSILVDLADDSLDADSPGN